MILMAQLSSNGVKSVLVVSLILKRQPAPERWQMDPLDSNFLAVTQTISFEKGNN